ncbi:polyribonucleotide nucleotidyltransferase [Candidatus Collierbacteria bacterium]|nr:polyribonucleotide nucleotidyltransferase [Candidatus Collierbacteria bacterium]
MTLSDNRQIILETGRYGEQATAAVTARLGDTLVFAAVSVGRENPEIDYLPLMVEYQEKLYAGGKIKGSRWVKREGRSSDEAILTSRLIDRSIRPLFPKSFRREIQIIITTLSVDGENDPDMTAIIATAAALSISGLPFAGPVGSVRIGYVSQNGTGTFVANPTHQDRQYSDLDLIVSGTKDGIHMVEAGANQVSETIVLSGMKFAEGEINRIIAGISELKQKVGTKDMKFTLPDETEMVKISKVLKKKYIKELLEAIKGMATKESDSDINELVTAISEKEGIIDPILASAALNKAIYQLIREQIVDKSIRPDGRKLDEIRQITVRVGELPRTHGSAMFQRGSTQALSIVTLASPASGQLLESPESEVVKHYIHHYNMPPFSIGETGRLGWPSRREIGHGALAERALVPVIPSKTQFPYTIRVVSEIMSGNGSTSMASVCGSTLALMDAGVPILAPVAGIAMGLIIENDKTAILSDIIGLEDFKGDMDFKVAGTEKGITAMQMDVKVKGISFEILEKALAQAKDGRMFILGKMIAMQPSPNLKISKFAPKISVVQIDPEKIGGIIGPGGKIIRRIIAETGAQVDVEDDGTVTISGTDEAGVQKAIDWVKGLTEEAEIGKEYDGKIVRIVPFGVFVNILPGKDGLIHISKLATGYLNHPEDVVKEGDNLKVKVAEVDDQDRINLVPVTPLTAPAGQNMPSGRRPAGSTPSGGYFGGGDRRPDSNFRRRESFGDQRRGRSGYDRGR